MLKSIYYSIIRHYWDIGFVSLKDGRLEEEWSISYIKHKYKDRLFADPFILDVNEDSIELLVEEYRYKTHRGRIAKLVVDKQTLEVREMKILLDLDTHLSFPAIKRVDNEVYVYPENAEAGHCLLYRYNKAEEMLEPIKVLVDEPISDGVLCEFFDRPCLIATRRPHSTSSVIEFYESKSIFEEYSHTDTAIIDSKAGRGAGDVFSYQGSIIRPGQLWTATEGYGAGLSFQTIEKIDGHYKVKELFEKFPPKGYQGMHTFNSYGGYYVVDCRRYKRPLISLTLNKIVRLTKKIIG